MRSWEIQRRKAEKRRREAERRDRKKKSREGAFFRLVKLDAASGTETELMTESVIVKHSDESVSEAGYDEIQPGMVLVVEGPSSLIERAVVEEKTDGVEGESVRTVRIRRV